MEKKKIIVMSFLLMAIVLLGIGTIAYFRRTVNGNITGQAGNLVLIVNEADAVLNETFFVSLDRSEEEPFVMPDDKGTFDLNIDSTGSSTDVAVTISISRSNLPDNLKFYLDEEYTDELTTKTYTIKKADTMTKTVSIYWYWDGSKDDINDTEFIGQSLSANISVTATAVQSSTLLETLQAQTYTLDTDVDFTYSSKKFLETDQCYEYESECNENGNYCEELEQQCFEENGNGLMLMEDTQYNEYPIFYYRGDVVNNNLIYANLCWLIVRTTETGGIKLVFNGPVVNNSDGTKSCTNYNVEGVENTNTSYTDVFAGNGETMFNTNNSSPIYVGYMYNDTNTYFTGTLDADGYINHLSNNTVNSETGEHIQNETDSTIKEVIDAWYEANILGKPEESLLEDTVWCNDRSVISENYIIENYETNGHFSFAAHTRLFGDEGDAIDVTPNLVCTRNVDKFTVNSANGNGDLEYPVGLLTADEMTLAGVSGMSYTSIYLNTYNGFQWSMSPSTFISGEAYMLATDPIGLYLDEVTNSLGENNGAVPGARPSISLGNEAKITKGDGSFQSPYIIS